jgi:hypothetical protein
MNVIDKNIKKIVTDLIRKEARSEALEILEKCSEHRFNEFLAYHIKDSGNICCMVLDVAKSELVASNQMKHDVNDHFGSPYLDTTEKDI